jgi:hypothetical protein
MLRRVMTVLISVSTLIALSAGAAQAQPAPSPTAETVAVPFTLGIKTGVSEVRAVRVAPAGKQAKALQDPPLGGCSYNDIAAQGTAYYTDGVLSSVTVSFHAIATCATTAPGQSMAGIIADSSFWLNGSVKANGRTGSCTNCLGAQSLGSWSGGPGSSGTIWAGGLFIFKLPAGWIWTGLPANCHLLSPDTPETLQCSGVSDTGYIPPTRP